MKHEKDIDGYVFDETDVEAIIFFIMLVLVLFIIILCGWWLYVWL